MLRKTELFPVGALALATCIAAACSSTNDKDELGLGAASASTAAGTGSGAAQGGSAGGSAAGGSVSVGTGASSAMGGTTMIIVNGGSGNVSASGGDDGDPSHDAGAGGEVGEGTKSAEKCDGIDNDGNGIIDDVDEGHDGVCDCLAIGTIGEIGPYSNGGDVFAAWLKARSPQGAVSLGNKVLTPELLAPLQVIVALYVDTSDITVEHEDGSAPNQTAHAHHVFSDDEANAFGQWVKKGGGAMTTIGYASNEAAEVVNINRLLEPVGMAYSSTKIGLSGYVTDWVEHPVTEGVSNIFTDNGVEPDGPEGTTLAHDADGHVALQVTEAGDGRVIVWGDEWITYDSQWVDLDDQQVELFWVNMLKWLSPPKTCQVPIPPTLVR